jgi:hypothetical protein
MYLFNIKTILKKNTAFYFLIILILLFYNCKEVTNNSYKNNESNITPKIKVYLLGTFHFAQTDSSYNVLDEKHQQSIEALSDIIAIQKPDKIFVERQPEYEFQNKINTLYKSYLKLKKPLQAKNEIYQLGFRAAKKLGHKKLYQCDHPGQYGRYNRATIDYANKNKQTDILSAKRFGTVERYDDRINTDSLMQNLSLLNYIQWLNSEKVLKTAHAAYISNYPQIGSIAYYDYDDDNTLIGAELIADWYKRNIMIYTKMINQVSYKKDKAIILIMGADHIPIIKNLFDANPFFKVVKTSKWLKK